MAAFTDFEIGDVVAKIEWLGRVVGFNSENQPVIEWKIAHREGNYNEYKAEDPDKIVVVR